MRTIAKLFGRSPFVPLQAHMEKVADAMALTRPLLAAYIAGKADEVERLAQAGHKAEDAADRIKNDIIQTLRKGIFLPVDRGRMIKIVGIQDSLADRVGNLSTLVTLKPCTEPPSFQEAFEAFLGKNLEAFDAVERIIREELGELLEASFGGAEAQRVVQQVRQVAELEAEADHAQHALLRKLFNSEGELTHTQFDLWQRLTKQVGQIANTSERLAIRVRETLDIK